VEPGSPLKDSSHQLLRRVLRAPAPAGGHHWHVLCQAMIEVSAGYTPAGESLLREVIASGREIPLSDVSPVPHAMSPGDALKVHAIQALGRWNKIRRRDVATLERQGAPAIVLAVARAQPVADEPAHR